MTLAAASEWGLVVIVVALLAGLTIKFRRRSAEGG